MRWPHWQLGREAGFHCNSVVPVKHLMVLNWVTLPLNALFFGHPLWSPVPHPRVSYQRMVPYMCGPFERELDARRFDCCKNLIVEHASPLPFPLFQVLSYTVTNMSDLTAKTRDFRDAMFDSTVPWQMIDSAAGRVSVIRCVIHGNKILVQSIIILTCQHDNVMISWEDNRFVPTPVKLPSFFFK